MDAHGLSSFNTNIRVGRNGHVATVTIDRPESRNGCTGEMWVTLGEVFRRLGSGGWARAIVLTGANGNFCTGADLSGMGASTAQNVGESGRGSMLDSMRVLGEAVMGIAECPVPVVARVEGLCVGAGLGLALAADLTYCADDARLSAIFAKRGLSMDFGTSWFLRQRLGVHRAKELAFTGRIITGAEAAALGLVNAAVPADRLDAVVDEVVGQIASGPPIALSMTKKELNLAANASLAQALETEALSQAINTTTEDMREAMMAYVERRTPEFKGR